MADAAGLLLFIMLRVPVVMVEEVMRWSQLNLKKKAKEQKEIIQ